MVNERSAIMCSLIRNELHTHIQLNQIKVKFIFCKRKKKKVPLYGVVNGPFSLRPSLINLGGKFVINKVRMLKDAENNFQRNSQALASNEWISF